MDPPVESSLQSLVESPLKDEQRTGSDLPATVCEVLNTQYYRTGYIGMALVVHAALSVYIRKS